MNIQDYEFHVGDEVITTDGIKGTITSICTCAQCENRGFYEPYWVGEDAGWASYIDKFTAETGFDGYYKIGEYYFHNFDKGEVLRDIAVYEDVLKRLRKKLEVIETNDRI